MLRFDVKSSLTIAMIKHYELIAIGSKMGVSGAATNCRKTCRKVRGSTNWKGLAKTDTINLAFLQKYGDRNVWSPKASIHA